MAKRVGGNEKTWSSSRLVVLASLAKAAQTTLSLAKAAQALSTASQDILPSVESRILGSKLPGTRVPGP